MEPIIFWTLNFLFFYFFIYILENNNYYKGLLGFVFMRTLDDVKKEYEQINSFLGISMMVLDNLKKEINSERKMTLKTNFLKAKKMYDEINFETEQIQFGKDSSIQIKKYLGDFDKSLDSFFLEERLLNEAEYIKADEILGSISEYSAKITRLIQNLPKR